MPSVVPTPRTSTCAAVTLIGAEDPSGPLTRVRQGGEQRPPVAITTMLFRIGVNVGAAKWPRVLRIAASSAAMP